MKTRKCESDQCGNLCKLPNRFCGHCADYAHEMTVRERQELLKGMLLTVAIAGPMRTKKESLRRQAGKGDGKP